MTDDIRDWLRDRAPTDVLATIGRLESDPDAAGTLRERLEAGTAALRDHLGGRYDTP